MGKTFSPGGEEVVELGFESDFVSDLLAVLEVEVASAEQKRFKEGPKLLQVTLQNLRASILKTAVIGRSQKCQAVKIFLKVLKKRVKRERFF